MIHYFSISHEIIRKLQSSTSNFFTDCKSKNSFYDLGNVEIFEEVVAVFLNIASFSKEQFSDFFEGPFPP